MHKKKKVDPLPESFSSAEEAGEFWDEHSIADFEEYFEHVSEGTEPGKDASDITEARKFLSR